MKKFLKSSISFLASTPIYFYKYCISPLLPHVCRYSPSCSNYFLQALKEYGVFKGCFLGLKRICRCTPRNKCYGYDPLPINIKGEGKWLF